MAILTDEEKRAILFRAQRDGHDREQKWNLQELGAALKIIEKTLGKQWYQKAGKNLFPEMPTKPPSNYNYLLEEQKLSPITALLRSGLPENYGRIIAFAVYIKQLWNRTNIEQKIADYERQERRGEIAFDHFNRFFFELKVAAFLNKKGLSVNFIPKQPKTTPDLKVTSPQGETFIECKKKDPQIEIEKRVSAKYQKVETEILNYMQQLTLNYSISIKFAKEITDNDIPQIVAIVYRNLLKQLKYFKEDIGNISIEGKQLMSHNWVHSSKEIPELPDPFTAQHFSMSAESNSPEKPYDLVKLREGNMIIRNFRIVSTYSSFIPSKVKSILDSITDASDQLLKSNAYGIVTVEISLGKNGQTELQKVLDSLPSLLENKPHINAVILFVEQTFNQGVFTHLSTQFFGYFNPSAINKLPEDIEKVLRAGIVREGDDAHLKSLLDD
jgi:hypothetical protein